MAMDRAEAYPSGSAPPVILRSVPTSTDAALGQLVRVILDEPWSPAMASSRLLALVGRDHAPLRRARVRVLDAAMERPTPITERALITLDLALGIPTQR